MELETGTQRGAFDEWVDAMRAWHRSLDVTPDPEVTLTAKFADSVPPEIGFGRYAGERRWERLADIPAPEIKDELLRLLVWQGDSEVRAVEQARELLDSAPTELEMVVPGTLTEREKQLYEELRAASKFDPRTHFSR
jgi:hypothetical protein